MRMGSGGVIGQRREGIWWCTKLKMKDEEEEGDLVVVVVDWWWTKATCRGASCWVGVCSRCKYMLVFEFSCA